MGIAASMNQIPSNLNVRLFTAELDRRGTSPGGQAYKTLLIGQRVTSQGSATANVPVVVGSYADAQAKFGIGSNLAHMFERYQQNDPSAEIWCVPLADGAGVAATGTITITGTATQAGTISILIGGRPIRSSSANVGVGVAIGDTGVGAGGIADDINTAINADSTLPVTSTVVTGTGVITLTAKHLGTIGNQIDVRANYATGQFTPAGITTAIVAMASGATDPSFATALTNIASMDFRFIVQPYNDHTNLNLFATELESRWDATRGLPTTLYSAFSSTYGSAVTYAASRNSPFESIPCLYASPMPPYETACAYAGQVAKSVRTHSVVPTTGRVLKGILAPLPSVRFSATERNTLAGLGIATLLVNDNNEVAIEAPFTTYLTDVNGASDRTFQSVHAVLTCAYLITDLRTIILANAGQKILVADASLVAPGTPAVDPATIKGWLVGRYKQLVSSAHVQDVETFIAMTTVEINADNPNRVDVLYAPCLAGQLNVLALLVRPFLRYPGE